jgi:radical SAM protein with 4Fe4S-binding SPASM domain
MPKPGVIGITGGEPTMHPRFFDILDAARGRARSVRVTSNGTLLTEALLAGMKAHGVMQLTISLDAAEPAIHDAIRGVPGSFCRTLKSFDMIKKLGMKFFIKTTLGNLNRNEFPGIIGIASRAGAAGVGVSRTIPIGRAKTGFEFISWPDYSKALRGGIKAAEELGITLLVDDPLRILVDDKFRSAAENEGSDAWGGCGAGVTMAYVLPNKDVIACPAFPYSMGNLSSKDFRTIWFSDRFKAVRTRDDLEGKCGGCSLKRLCGGCRGMAYAVSGNPMAEDPFCPKSA